MSIPELWEKIKILSEKEEMHHILMVFIVILVGLAGFGLGRISQGEDLPVRIEYGTQATYPENKTSSIVMSQKIDTTPSPQTGTIIASKNGTKYYFSTCSGSSRIKEENKIYFQNESEAMTAGYSKASGCK